MFDVVFTFNLQHSTFNHNRYQQEGCTWCEAVREIRYSTAHKKSTGDCYIYQCLISYSLFALSLLLQRCCIYYKPIAYIAFKHALVGVVYLVYVYHFHFRYYVVLGAVVKHLLCFAYATY